MPVDEDLNRAQNNPDQSHQYPQNEDHQEPLSPLDLRSLNPLL